MAATKIAMLKQELERLQEERMQYSNVSDNQLAPINDAIERIKEQIEEEKNKKLKNLQNASAQMDGMIAQKNAAQMTQYKSGVHE